MDDMGLQVIGQELPLTSNGDPLMISTSTQAVVKYLRALNGPVHVKGVPTALILRAIRNGGSRRSGDGATYMFPKFGFNFMSSHPGSGMSRIQLCRCLCTSHVSAVVSALSGTSALNQRSDRPRLPVPGYICTYILLGSQTDADRQAMPPRELDQDNLSTTHSDHASLQDETPSKKLSSSGELD